jgi:predicted RNA binding protein YcfA (HicA-like mRNA interferase family)
VKDFGKPIRDRLSNAGCSFLRHGKGDHDVWITPQGKRIVVPVQIKSRHTANGILKEAGLSKVF